MGTPAYVDFYAAWDGAATYPVGSIVEYGGSAYIASAVTTGETPGVAAVWHPMAFGAVGPAGPQGIPGTGGATGPAGPTGPQGPDGAPGATGPAGAAGATGPKGDAGAQGSKGDTGTQGIQGPTGPQGDAGAQGIAGPTGPQGLAGTQGIQGLIGNTGPQGIQGIPGPSILTTVKLTADETGKTDATLANTGLTFPVANGVYYAFQFFGTYRSTVLTVGLKLALTVPAFTVFSAQARIGGFAADGAASAWHGVINTSGDSVISTAVAANNVDLPFVIEGVILPSAGGSVTVQYAAETTGATVTLRRGSLGVLTTV